jgi:hypothetical protein
LHRGVVEKSVDVAIFLKTIFPGFIDRFASSRSFQPVLVSQEAVRPPVARFASRGGEKICRQTEVQFFIFPDK